jgi:DNA-binding response OmpR family regulator
MPSGSAIGGGQGRRPSPSAVWHAHEGVPGLGLRGPAPGGVTVQIGGSPVSNDADVILIVGETPSCDPLARELVLDGYRTLRAANLQQLGALAESGQIDLIILTPASEQASRLHAVRALRAGELDPQISPGLRILWISASDQIAEVLRAFDAGADDVLRSPFVHAELLARARALMRRGALGSAGVIQLGPLQIDTNAHAVMFASTPVHLRRLEYALLVHLARDPARVYTKDDLLRELWGYRASGFTRTVDTHACRLRRALVQAGATGWLVAVRGVGYRLAPDGHGELHLLMRRRSA